MLTPQNQAKLNCLGHTLQMQWCKSFGMVIFLFHGKTINLLGAVKLHCLSLHTNLFLKLFGHGIIQGCSEMLGLQLSDKTEII